MEPQALLAALPKVVDRFMSLLRIGEVRMQRRFAEFWSPAFQELQSVHADYLRMYTEIELIFDGSSPPTAEDADVEPTARALKYLKRKRLELAPVRDSIKALDGLRTDAELRAKFSEAEREFLDRVLNYIRPVSLPDSIGSRSAGLVDEVQRIAQQELSAQTALDRMSLPAKVDELATRWQDVSASFHRLRLNVISKST